MIVRIKITFSLFTINKLIDYIVIRHMVTKNKINIIRNNTRLWSIMLEYHFFLIPEEKYPWFNIFSFFTFYWTLLSKVRCIKLSKVRCCDAFS